MKIITNCSLPIAPSVILSIASEYCRVHVEKVVFRYNQLDDEYRLVTTGKCPVIVTVSYRNYHVTCRKTRTSYVLDIWLAV